MKKILIILTLFLIIHPKSFAQEVAIGIYPPILQIEMVPPASVATPFEIQNMGNETIDLDIKFRPFTASPKENGEVRFFDDNQFPLDDPFLFEKIKVLDGTTPITSLTLGPGQKKKLTLGIALPENQIRSDYYFSILFLSKSASPSNLSASQITGGIGTNVLLTVGPKGETKGYIEEFSAPFYISSGPVPFKVRVKNESGHFITTEGIILIKNMFGQTIGKVDLLPVNILSNTIRSVPDILQSPEATRSAKLNPEEFAKRYEEPVAVWHERILFGPYTANLVLNLGEGGPVFKKQINFFAFPIETIIGIFAVLAILTFIILRVKKRV